MDYFDELSALFESEDADLFKPKPKRHTATPDDRLIDSFGEITAFVREHGRMPSAEADDMQEAVLGTRLNAIRADKHKMETLEDYDELGLLQLEKAPESLEDLFAKDDGLFGSGDIFDTSKLPRSPAADKNTGDTAKRQPVEDFAPFKPLFDAANNDLQAGTKKLKKFYSVKEIALHGFYVLDGMMCYVESIGEAKNVFGRQKERLRVIYANGTESNIYLRTLASQLYEDTGYSVVEASAAAEDDEAVGRIYILESLSEDPKVTTIANLYKIGVTTGSVANRVKNAATDPTYLMAPVKIIEDYRLTGDYNPQKVEDLIHQIFGHAKIDLQIIAPDGTPYTPQEWYSAPLAAIVEAIDLIGTGEIVNYHYDSAAQVIMEN
ncbi:MAG: GIY-YIG nuclease family protein [Candidatus Saccharimonas sp.]